MRQTVEALGSELGRAGAHLERAHGRDEPAS
jgi:hypothetical protein